MIMSFFVLANNIVVIGLVQHLYGVVDANKIIYYIFGREKTCRKWPDVFF